MKKAQVSLFILLGIFILVIIVITMFLTNGVTIEKQTTSPTKEHIRAALRDISIEAMRDVSDSAGYYDELDEIITLSEEKQLLSLKEVETSLAKFVNDNLKITFPNKIVEQEPIQTKVMINKNDVIFRIISKFTEDNTEITNIEIKHTINLYGIYELTADTIKLEETFDTTKYVEDFITKIIKKEGITYYSVEDPFTELDGVVWMFGN